MTNFDKIKIFTVVLIGSFFFTNIANADISIIVHKESPLSSITIKEAKRIFLGVTKKMPNGQNIKIVDYSNNSNLKKSFYMELTNKSVAQIKSRWAGLVFSGRATPPLNVKGNNEVKKWLRENINGIGYIDSSSLDSSIKVILTIKN